MRKLDVKSIESKRQQRSKANRREEEKQRIRDGYEQNRQTGRVTVIPAATITQEMLEAQKLRVAAYCRVSTAEEKQAGSFEIQRQHFRQVIENNPRWEIVDIYADE